MKCHDYQKEQEQEKQRKNDVPLCPRHFGDVPIHVIREQNLPFVIRLQVYPGVRLAITGNKTKTWPEQTRNKKNNGQEIDQCWMDEGCGCLPVNRAKSTRENMLTHVGQTIYPHFAI